jgi:hypothetical protein
MGESALRKSFWFGPALDMKLLPTANERSQSDLQGGISGLVSYYADRFVLNGGILVGHESRFGSEPTGVTGTCHNAYTDYDCEEYDNGKAGRFYYGARLQGGYLLLRKKAFFHVGIGGEYLRMIGNSKRSEGSQVFAYGYIGLDSLDAKNFLPGIQLMVGPAFESESNGKSYKDLFIGFSGRFMF